MTWKKCSTDIYERPCRHCGGTGREIMLPGDWQACKCFEHWTMVDHPSNTESSKEIHCVWNELRRCDVCGLVWVYFWEATDDSMDVPAPEIVGRRIPGDDWRVKR